jgi:hypothetical protein
MSRAGEEGRRLSASLAEEGLQPSRMGFHGELMFLLLGVKPAVLCTFPAAACGSCARPQLAALYASQVLLPALRSAGGAIASDTDSADPSTRSWQVRVGDKRLRLGVVNTSVESAYYEEVGGSLIVYNVDDDRAASSALRLLSPAATRVSEKEAQISVPSVA